MGMNLPPDATNVPASAIVRAVEDQKKLETIAKQQAEMERRRREAAMREEEARRRQANTTGKK